MPLPKYLCIFEDEAGEDLRPLTHLHPVFELRCGMFTLRERIARFFPEALIYLRCREEQAALLRERLPGARIQEPPPGGCLYVAGNVLMDEIVARRITSRQDVTFVCGGKTVAFWNGQLTARREEIALRAIRYPWDPVRYNREMIVEDFMRMPLRREGHVDRGVHLVETGSISLGRGVRIKPGVVVDAENGPVILEDRVTVMPNAVIEGPCWIGPDSLIKAGAKIYGGTSIGPTSKVGGEVETSILHGFSNKQHDGFLGHSYVGEWCNLGADTNTSDLKNNYGTVKVPIGGREADTGLLFVGLTMGDHSKSGINTMFNTGTVVGVSCNVFGSGFPPKYLPSFTWCDGLSIEEYRVDKAIEVARAVMLRRGQSMSSAYETLLRRLFEDTSAEREKAKAV
jgi:UDP-N-acetylglucosamine diphosphorylase/glucosamine-1-phosphate N-acetyltransferase